MTNGYSGTPLWRKLGLKDGMRAAVVNPPAGYFDDLLAGGPDVLWDEIAPDAAFVHVFTPQRAELQDLLTQALPLIARDAMIWVSWPKTASQRPTDITEDVVRAVALPMGLVDVKVCAVDRVWSGLKLVIRKKLR